MSYKKPNFLCYWITQIAAWFVATLIFRRKILRNELRGKRGPFLVIANHQAAWDFVNLIGVTSRRMSFVISSSFYHSLPIRGFLSALGMIPKQQFQTTVRDLKRMKAVTDRGEGVVIYPAGLMCEDGLSTPIPAATYKFLKWMGVDIYVARTSGTYFVMPKWGEGMRAGRTYLDVYRLFSAEELKQMDLEQIRQRAEEALLFDAYREQEEYQVKYRGGNDLKGLEYVLYQCPHCDSEFTIRVLDDHRLCCSACGYEQVSDEYAFLHNSGHGPKIRYVSDWSKLISQKLEGKITSGELTGLSAPAGIYMIDHHRKKFTDVGQGTVRLDAGAIVIDGQIRGERGTVTLPLAGVPTLPFKPGKYLEVQQGSDIYRCVLEDGWLVMKFINMIKIFHGINGVEQKSSKNAAVG